ncbi:protease pro-enzyme activation domain-containing protein [Granulicella arctica]|uniref:Subtilase family serine protease n=1 Tax=Granulicella arctica TaxID=940613 RepID=A0A7Y9PG49_9BACT|nr:protease pro-enzyme activation domain-containing protein [Granulicella arctica]NYF79282.1 subtilase family serine protease [Granulicella arctica]
MPRIVRRLLSTFVLFGAVFSAAAQSSQPAQSPQADRIAAHPNLRPTTRLAGHLPAWANSANDAGVVPDNTSLRLTFVLARSPERQAAFTQLLADQQNPASSSYHHWLTPQQIGTLYGPTQHDLDALTVWLTSQGLTVTAIAPSRVFVTVEAPASTVANALSITFHYFNLPAATGEPAAKPRLSATSNPAIPVAFATLVTSISGLADIPLHPMSQSHSMAMPPSSALHPDYTYSSTQHFLTPGDFATIFDITSIYNSGINGAGQKVAIIGGSRVANTDISEFESLIGATANLPNVIIPPTGTDPGIAANTDQGEAVLDVIRVLGTAPSAQADLVVSGNLVSTSGIYIAAEYEVQTLLDPIMNISFSSCEASTAGQSDVNSWNTLFSQAAAEGISVFISSGDSGAATCDKAFTTPPTTQQLSINTLCASSYATCVGGTELNDTANLSAYWSSTDSSNGSSALSYIPEGGWNEPTTSTGATIIAASGGGASIYIAKPSWQTGTGVPSDSHRDVPDMSFPAAGHNGYFACYAYGGGDCANSHFQVFAGTSASAPSMAGVTALLNQKIGTSQGNLNPLLYHLAALASSPFHDATPATSGVAGCSLATPSMCNNSTPGVTSLTGGLAGYALTTGYDQVTGLGSLDVANFLGGAASVTGISLTSASSSLTLTAGATTGNTDAITVNSAFYDGTAALGCTVSYNGTGTPTFIPTCSFSPGSVTLPANGSAVSTLTLSTTAAQAAAVATATHPAQPIPTRSSGHTPTGLSRLTLCSILLLTLLPARRRLRSLRSWQTLPTALLLLVTLGALSACSGSSTAISSNPLLISTTTTALTAASTSLNLGATDIFTATVANAGFNTAVTPTGTVQFLQNGTVIGTATLSGGIATSTAITFATAGTYNITAVYQGDDNFSTSTSAKVPLTVTATGTTLGSYTVTIKATGADSITATTTVALTIQ